MEARGNCEEVNGNIVDNYKNVDEYSLQTLNEDCLIHIFQYLNLHDCINLSESCIQMRKIADREVYHRKFANLKIDHKMINSVKTPIDRVLSHVGHHIKTLSIHTSLSAEDDAKFNRMCICVDIVLSKLKDKCKNLELIYINGWNVNCSAIPSLCDLKSLKSLTLNRAMCRGVDVFTNTQNLKHLFITNSYNITKKALKQCFVNNPDIESFMLDNRSSYLMSYKCLTLLARLEKLSLRIEKNDPNCIKLEPLLQLKRLKKLRLDCEDNNLTEFLMRLAKKGIIEELEIYNVNSDALDKLQLFEDLELLAVKGINTNKLRSISSWPPHLKHLQLDNFELTFIDFIDLIRQNKVLENINLFHCRTSNDDYFGNVTNIFEKTEQVLRKNNFVGERMLTLTLPSFCYMNCEIQSKNKYLLTSPGLRIVNRGNVRLHPCDIRINFLVTHI